MAPEVPVVREALVVQEVPVVVPEGLVAQAVLVAPCLQEGVDSNPKQESSVEQLHQEELGHGM